MKISWLRLILVGVVNVALCAAVGAVAADSMGLYGLIVFVPASFLIGCGLTNITRGWWSA